jgi:predicted O-methyltransferase YrrM
MWVAARWLVPRPYRELFEGHLHIPGQMWFEDRRVLYNTIRALKPQRCFEVGTWMGGGSTLVIARALRDNGGGKLHTIEVLPDVYEAAVERYQRRVPDLLPYVEFHQGDYAEIFPSLLDAAGGVDFFVLDGAEDGEQTLEQFRFFDERSHAGTGLFAHDWETEKARLVRAELESSDTWQIQRTVGEPKSVGLAIATRRV